MSREQLIAYIDELKQQRAFSPEDRYLLQIIDNSPFTIWASDRNCIIRFWEGRCETLYGHKKEDVIGKDFVDLFVAPDEQKAAREDQLKIIDSGEVFHNIANDHAKTGNVLRLLTNCWRMKASDTDEYWNIEMGLIVDYYDQEIERLEQIVIESRLYKTRVTKFLDLSKQIRHHYAERRNNFSEAIRECRRQAVIASKSTEYKPYSDHYRKVLKDFDERLNNLIDDYTQKVQECGSSSRCEELVDCFKEDHEELLGEFEDEIISFEEVARKYTPDVVVLGKDTVLKECAFEYERLVTTAVDLKLNINQRIDAYKSHVSKNSGSTVFAHYVGLIERIEAIISSLRTLQDKTYKAVGNVQNYEAVRELRSSTRKQYAEIEQLLNEVEQAYKKGHD